MTVFTDQTGRKVFIGSSNRVVSLVPSITELLFDLGLGDRVVGITKFCVHPATGFRTKTKVGGTKQLNPEIIRHLDPDLIIANKEENGREQIEEIAGKYPVWVSDVSSLEEACEMIRQIGRITQTDPKAAELVAGIKKRFSGLPTPNSRLPTPNSGLLPPNSRLRAAYIIWQNPYMTAGGDTFIHAMLDAAGFENLFAGKKRYPKTTVEEINAAGCDCLFLSTEPYPFKQKHVAELQERLPGTRILLVDGEMFSWYGSRLLLAPEYFSALREKL